MDRERRGGKGKGKRWEGQEREKIGRGGEVGRGGNVEFHHLLLSNLTTAFTATLEFFDL